MAGINGFNDARSKLIKSNSGEGEGDEPCWEEKDKKIEKGIERARDKDTERETDKDLYIYGYIQYIERDTNI